MVRLTSWLSVAALASAGAHALPGRTFVDDPTLLMARDQAAPNVVQPRGAPAEPKGVKTVSGPNGSKIRYKSPGICETTPGVGSYSGYVDLDEDTHVFFWFFEARKNAKDADLTLWLNGGPGSDSMLGLFQELGPCSITEDLKTHHNPYAWNEASNMLFLSQPAGVGFSYGYEEEGYLDLDTGNVVKNATDETDPMYGRFSQVNPYQVDTTEKAAKATWEVLQAFIQELPAIDHKVKSKKFNLWTESYGGHYGPAFYRYFEQENKKIGQGKKEGVHLDMNSLGIINGIIDARIQMPQYPEFARNNTYGIELVNQTAYDVMKFNLVLSGGCLDSIDYCHESNISTLIGKAACAEATSVCRNMVEGVYYANEERGVYDIRHPYDDPDPPVYFVNYLNQSEVQEKLGVDVNYTMTSSTQVFEGFDTTGDYVYGTLIKDLEHLVAEGVRVGLYYGDADYICNWFGGEQISLNLDYKYADEFKKAGYAPFMVNGTQYGEVRQYGNFSFARIYEAGHEIPFYQPEAALAFFRREINHKDVATGKDTFGKTYSTSGNAETTHTESAPPLSSATATASSSSS